MEISEEKIVYCKSRKQWRNWLHKNFQSEKEAWFVFPLKQANEKSVSYNDAVEEALCFGWIDGIAKPLDETHQVRRFTPRRKGSAYSRPNIERLINMDEKGLIHPEVRTTVAKLINKKFVYPKDIVDALKKDKTVWKNYQAFPDPYKRIRIAYIDAARKRPEEFERRLNNFMNKTRENRMITGYGGIEKYYE